MFGKSRELNDITHLDGPSIEGFFGDESAAAEVVRVNELHQRITQVESQINSQFTSLATYAQIAQEQVELARAEAKASTDRSEQRLTELIERERSDRIAASETHSAESPGNVVNIGSARSAMDDRLDALERSVAQIKITLDGCFAQQLALADAISKLFEQTQEPEISEISEMLPPPVVVTDLHAADGPLEARATTNHVAPPWVAPVMSSPIPGLSLRLDIA